VNISLAWCHAIAADTGVAVNVVTAKKEHKAKRNDRAAARTGRDAGPDFLPNAEEDVGLPPPFRIPVHSRQFIRHLLCHLNSRYWEHDFAPHRGLIVYLKNPMSDKCPINVRYA
jgi:hypothetical protein